MALWNWLFGRRTKHKRRQGRKSSRPVARKDRCLFVEHLEQRRLLSAGGSQPQLLYYIKPITTGDDVGTAAIVSTTGDYEGGGTTGTSYGNPYTIVLDSDTAIGQTVNFALYASIFGTGGDPTADGFVSGALDVLNRPDATPLGGSPNQVALLQAFKNYGYSKGMIQGDIDAVPDGGLDLGGPLNVSTPPDNTGSWIIPSAADNPAFGSSFNNNGWVDIELGTFTFTVYDSPASGASTELSARPVVNSGFAPVHTFLADSIDPACEIGTNGSDVLSGPAVEIAVAGTAAPPPVVPPPSHWKTIAEMLAERTPDPHPSGEQPSDSSGVVVLTEYTPAPILDPGIAEMEPLVQGEEQIEASILSNADARPSYWGESLATGGDDYRLHLNDNGMLVSQWTVDWGDGSDPQQVANAPWVIHSYPGGAGQYQITVTAGSPNGTFSGGAGGSTGGGLSGYFGTGIDTTSTTLHPHGPQPEWANPIGNGGQTTTNFESTPGWDQAAAIALDNGNLLVAGTTGDGQFGLARYTDQPGSPQDGEPDTNFGSGGLVITTFTAGTASASAVAVDGNANTIVVAGTVLDGDGHHEVALARYTDADGSLDTAFGTGGLVTTDLGSGWTSTAAVVVLNDSSILVAGTMNGHFAILHYAGDGTQDTSFGGGATDGIVTVDFGGSAETPSAMAIDSNGLILVAGTTTQTGTGKDFALARFNADGTPDTAFGNNGLVTTDFAGGDDVPSALAIQPNNGKIVLAGDSTQSGSDLLGLVRYNLDGSLDTSFGTGGLVTTNFGDGHDRAGGVQVQFDGKIVVSGSTFIDGSGNTGSVDHFALARYNSDGTLDTSFGTGSTSPTGTVTTDFSALGFVSDAANGLVLDTTGRLVVAGTATESGSSSYAVACYDPGTSTVSVQASDVPPVLAVVGDQQTTAGQVFVLPEIGRFTHSSIAGDFNYQINWGDGSVTDSGPATIISQGSQTNPLVGSIGGQHTYSASGMYYVATTVTDPDGGSDTQTFLVTVNGAVDSDVEEAPPVGDSSTTPASADPALLAAVRQTLGLAANANVSDAQWASLISLTADSNKVLSLDGLKKAVNLQSLTLVPGDFSNPGYLTTLTQLSGLSQLKTLTLQRCGINDTVLSTLPTNLTALTTLDLRYNSFTTLPTAFFTASNWANLTSLLVYGNPLNSSSVNGDVQSVNYDPTPTWCGSLRGRLLTVDIAPKDTTSIIAGIDPTQPANTFKAVAAAFYNLPIEIYQYLVNTIKFQPYQGAMKGPLGVLQSGAGNDWDTDSLLVRLFSNGGIDTSKLQYAYFGDSPPNTGAWGIVENVQTAMQLVGVKTPSALYHVLWNNALIPSLLDAYGNPINADTQENLAVNVRFQHAWLQWVIGGQTFYLDPVWKVRDFQAGIPDFLTRQFFNDITYLAQPQKETAAEFYADQVRSYLADPANPSLNGLTIADVPYDGPIHTQVFTGLPTQVPYDNSTGTISYYSSIPWQYEHQLRISVDLSPSGYTLSGSYDPQSQTTTLTVNPSFLTTIITASMSGAPFFIDRGSGPEEFTSIGVNLTWQQVVVQGDAHCTAATFYAPGLTTQRYVQDIDLKRITISTDGTPMLRVEGESPLVNSFSVQSGTSVYVVIEYTSGTPGLTVAHFSDVYKRTLGEYMAIAVDAHQGSPQALLRARQIVNQQQIINADSGTPDRDALIGGFLSLAGASYFYEADQGQADVCGLTSGMPRYVDVQTALLSTPTNDPSQLQFAGDSAKLQFPYLPQSMLLDAKGGNWAEDAIDDVTSNGSTNYNVERSQIVAYTMSSMEGIVWEELTDLDSISTVKALQLANIQTGNSLTTVSPGGIAPTTLPQAIQDSINGYLAQNYQVYTPTHEITLGSGSSQWHGVGYVVRKHDPLRDPTGQLWWDWGEIIQGALNGQPIGEPHGGDAEWHQVTVPVADTTFNAKTTPDPISTANGDLTHDETDFTIPNLGVPLAMARHYDSFNTVPSGTTQWSDRGMGEGWSFTYSDTITAANANNDPTYATDPFGTVVWITNTGLRLVFKYVSGTGTSTIYTTPATVFGMLTVTATGYLWTDKTGARTTFTNYTVGGVTTAYVTQISDRYNDGTTPTPNYYNGVSIVRDSATAHILTVSDLSNSTRRLTFTYTGSHITSISDSTGRTWVYGYDSAGRLVSATAPLTSTTPLGLTQYTYFTDSRQNDLLQSVTDPDGNETQFTYYANRRGFQVTDAEGNTESVSFNIYRSQASYTDERGQVTRYATDGNGNPTEQLNPDQTTITSTWLNDLKMSDTDAYGQSTDYHYDADGNLIETSDPLEEVVLTQYTSISLANGAKLEAPSQTTRLGRPDPKADSTPTFTSVAPPDEIKDNGASLVIMGNGSVPLSIESYMVDANTMLALDFSDDGSSPQIQSLGFDTLNRGSPTWIYQFQLAGTTTTSGIQDFNDYTAAAPNVSHYVIPVGRYFSGMTMHYMWFVNQTSNPSVWSEFSHIHLFEVAASAVATTAYTYSPDGSLNMLTAADGNKTTYTYPGTNRGLPATIIAPNGYGIGDGMYTTTYGYNAAGQTIYQSSAVAPGQSIAQYWSYDGLAGSRGYLTGSTDGNNKTTSYTYDLLGHLLSATQPVPNPAAANPLPAPVTISVQDATGRSISTSLATGFPQRTANSVYDKMGRVTESVSSDSTYTTAQYDPTGNLVYLADAMGRVTQYVRDSRGRQIAAINPDGTVLRAEYDGGSRVVGQTDALGNTTQYVYDKLGRKIQQTLPDPDSGGPLDSATTRYGYDPLGNLQYVTDALVLPRTTSTIRPITRMIWPDAS